MNKDKYLYNMNYTDDKYNELYSNTDPGYDTWFRAKVEEGFKALEEGRFISNEEAKRRSFDRKKRLLMKI